MALYSMEPKRRTAIRNYNLEPSERLESKQYAQQENKLYRPNRTQFLRTQKHLRTAERFNITPQEMGVRRFR